MILNDIGITIIFKSLIFTINILTWLLLSSFLGLVRFKGVAVEVGRVSDILEEGRLGEIFNAKQFHKITV
jgi:hypothetical protein